MSSPIENQTDSNVDAQVVRDFGYEWHRFDQRELSDAERLEMFDQYFSLFPWHRLEPTAVGFDAGCGTGRWAVLVAPKVARLYCVDPSAAIHVAKKNLADFSSCVFCQTTVDEMPIADNSMDFGYSLGVLHHVPDTQRGIEACVRRLKRGAPLLLYLYYAFDNQPAWFRVLWRISDGLRRLTSKLPQSAKYVLTQIIALCVYLPLARIAKAAERFGIPLHSFPLSAYRNRSFYSMRTDALDRFGTRLERRFTRQQIQSMMERAGLENIQFRTDAPYWCAVGYKK